MKLNRDTSADRSEEGASEYHVLGGGHLGRDVTRRLRAQGHEVSPDSEFGFQGDPTDVEGLEAAGLATASTVVVLANAPSRVEVFAEAGHDPVRATSALSDALLDTV